MFIGHLSIGHLKALGEPPCPCTCPSERHVLCVCVAQEYLRYANPCVWCAGHGVLSAQTLEKTLPPSRMLCACLFAANLENISAMLTLVCFFVHVQMETQICGNSWYYPPPLTHALLSFACFTLRSGMP